MSKRSTHHATFVIERDYAAPPAKVFAAWAQPKAKARWFVGPDEWEKSDHKLDFRVGGRAQRVAVLEDAAALHGLHPGADLGDE